MPLARGQDDPGAGGVAVEHGPGLLLGQALLNALLDRRQIRLRLLRDAWVGATTESGNRNHKKQGGGEIERVWSEDCVARP